MGGPVNWGLLGLVRVYMHTIIEASEISYPPARTPQTSLKGTPNTIYDRPQGPQWKCIGRCRRYPHSSQEQPFGRPEAHRQHCAPEEESQVLLQEQHLLLMM